MTLERAVRLSLLTLAGAGSLALALAVASPLWLLLDVVAFGACVVVGALRPAWHLRQGLASIAVLALVQAFLAEVVATGTFLVPAAHFLLLTQIVLLTQERKTRTYGLVCVMGLVHMVLAGVLSVDLGFGLCFLVFLPAGVATMLLLNLRGELERNRGVGPAPASPPRVRGRLLGAMGVVTMAELGLTVAVFLYFPRFGLQLFQLRPVQRGPTLIGFSDSVHLGDLSALLENAQPVMSVRLFQEGNPIEGATMPLRWRGIAHDTYENATWSTRGYISGEARYEPLGTERGFRPFLRGDCPGAEVVQEITLEPVNTRVLFYLSHLIGLRTATPNLDAVFWHTPSRTATSSRRSSVSLRYLATSRIPSWGAAQLRQRSRPGDRELLSLARFLQVPPTITPRVRALAEEIVAGIPEDAFYDRARAVEAYLKGHYEYSLHSGATESGVDPVEDFLFRQQLGHCEHFASAMAIFLRSLGIPSRVAAGFHGGEWNEYGQFYIVRQRNAHAWVEAYIPSVHEWEAFDPTPLAAAAPAPDQGWMAGLDRRLAHLRLVWNAYVVNFSTQEQQDIANAVNRWFARLSSVIPSWGGRWFAIEGGSGAVIGGWVATVVVLLLAGMGALWAFRRLRMGNCGLRIAIRNPRSEIRNATAFYRRMEAILRRRGFVRGLAATPLEFARGVVEQGGRGYAPALVIAGAFCRVRYGSHRLSQSEQSEVIRALTELEEGRARGAAMETGTKWHGHAPPWRL